MTVPSVHFRSTSPWWLFGTGLATCFVALGIAFWWRSHIADIVAQPYYVSSGDENDPLFLLATVQVVLVVALGVRALQWWLAAGAAPIQARGRIAYTPMGVSPIGRPWLVFSDSGQTYYQKLMWEDWLAYSPRKVRVDLRRAAGVIVVDVQGYGRLWPAGRTRKRKPKLTGAGPSGRAIGSRLTVLVVTAAMLPGLVVTHQLRRTGPVLFLLMLVYVFQVHLFLGGSPASISWRRK